jgi:DNA-directed RNA polymerase subunit RPC12/RpoP
MVKTECDNCRRQTPFKPHQANQYWYCQYCKSHIPLQPLTQLKNSWQGEVTKQFPDATHAIALHGEIRQGGDLVIKIPTISSHQTATKSRPTENSVMAYKGQDYLGEVFVEA